MFDFWSVYSGERFRASWPSCFMVPKVFEPLKFYCTMILERIYSVLKSILSCLIQSTRRNTNMAPVVDLKRAADSTEGPLKFNMQTGRVRTISKLGSWYCLSHYERIGCNLAFVFLAHLSTRCSR